MIGAKPRWVSLLRSSWDAGYRPKKGLSCFTGKSGLDFEEKVGTVTIPVAHAFNNLDAIVHLFQSTGVEPIAGTGDNAFEIEGQAFGIGHRQKWCPRTGSHKNGVRFTYGLRQPSTYLGRGKAVMTGRHKPWIVPLAVALLWVAGVIMAPVRSETVTLYVTNAQGTVVATMTPQGDVTYAAYRPYGVRVWGASQSGPGYTGHVNDPATGLVYMQQRYYDPSIGRFLSPDPIGPTPGNIFSFNRYAYGNNNPLRYTDPTGMCPIRDKNGKCEVVNATQPSNKKQQTKADKAQQRLEDAFNKYDKSVQKMKSNRYYSIRSVHHGRVIITWIKGSEIKKLWNTQLIVLVPNWMKFSNGGGGGASSKGLTQLTPNVVSGWGRQKNGVISLIMHEIAHQTPAGIGAAMGNAMITDPNNPKWQKREQQVQSIGHGMAGAAGMPFNCSASVLGCW